VKAALDSGDENDDVQVRVPFPGVYADKMGRVGLKQVPPATLHALPFIGGLFTYAHAIPQGALTHVNLPKTWTTPTAYITAILLAMTVGVFVAHFSTAERRAQRKKIRVSDRMSRLMGGLLTMSAMLFTTHIPFWPIAALGVAVIFHEGAYRYTNRTKRNSDACEHTARPTCESELEGGEIDVVTDEPFEVTQVKDELVNPSGSSRRASLRQQRRASQARRNAVQGTRSTTSSAERRSTTSSARSAAA
jgi:hypothetical protein